MEYNIDYNLIYRNNPSWLPILDEQRRAESLDNAFKTKEEKKLSRPVEPIIAKRNAPKVVIDEYQEKPKTAASPRRKVTYLADDGVKYDVEGSRVRNELRETTLYDKEGKRATV